ncbi:winged helix-turn-helix transcriptional regulator [Candidatus Pacearchaeota archaeon]|nr:winged helix-turn-helix transcriptional regulator [Candidatus Pacearchaeota archaeon]
MTDKIDLERKFLLRKFAALNNENRLKILFLCQENGRTIKELSKLIKLSHSKTSENTSILEREGLVNKTRNKDNTVTVKSTIKISKEGVKW